jgi:hypothetical protein
LDSFHAARRIIPKSRSQLFAVTGETSPARIFSATSAFHSITVARRNSSMRGCPKAGMRWSLSVEAVTPRVSFGDVPVDTSAGRDGALGSPFVAWRTAAAVVSDRTRSSSSCSHR